jgi:dTDP-4-dehydrorhamnose 3,5-epimerase
MGLTIEEAGLPGLKLVTPKMFGDARGYFAETFRQDIFHEAGIVDAFVQDNQSFSVKGVLRGLHAQVKRPQAKLVRAVTGEVFDAVVDARVGSLTFGRWYGVVLSGENLKQLYIPAGFLHGFCVLSEGAILNYQCSDYYDPTDNFAVMWDDKDLGIEWPVKGPIISAKDQGNLSWEKAKEELKRVKQG